MEGEGPGHLALESLLSPLSFVAPYLFVENTNGELGYILFFFFFFNFLAKLHGMWALSSLTRDRKSVPCLGSAES